MLGILFGSSVMEYIKVGRIINTFGLRGEVKVKSLTEFAEIRFKEGQQLYIEKDNELDIVIVKRMRWHRESLLVLFEQLEDINLVEKYKGCDIYISRENVHALPVGEYYYFELRGCSVYENNECIGQVVGVEDGYQTILRINTGKKDVLVPYVSAFIRNVSISDKRIDINSIQGLL